MHINLLKHEFLLEAELPAIDSSQSEELEGTTQLPQQQLELLGKQHRISAVPVANIPLQAMYFHVLAVNDESLRGMLKDKRLQKEIFAVDTADDREKVKPM